MDNKLRLPLNLCLCQSNRNIIKGIIIFPFKWSFEANRMWNASLLYQWGIRRRFPFLELSTTPRGTSKEELFPTNVGSDTRSEITPLNIKLAHAIDEPRTLDLFFAGLIYRISCKRSILVPILKSRRCPSLPKFCENRCLIRDTPHQR